MLLLNTHLNTMLQWQNITLKHFWALQEVAIRQQWHLLTVSDCESWTTALATWQITTVHWPVPQATTSHHKPPQATTQPRLGDRAGYLPNWDGDGESDDHNNKSNNHDNNDSKIDKNYNNIDKKDNKNMKKYFLNIYIIISKDIIKKLCLKFMVFHIKYFLLRTT